MSKQPCNRRDLLKNAGGLTGALLLRRDGFGARLRSLPSLGFDIASAESARLASDPRRPQYHLLPAANWMNDPNGPIYHHGLYHMFYQYNPGGAYWGDMHWAHAVSPDTIHWKHLAVALAPTPGGPDAAGCFSGSAVIDNGTVTVLYTGVTDATAEDATIRDGKHSFRESQCLATSADPELKTWTKLHRPVISTPPAGVRVTGFRDPTPWKSGDSWYMTVGAGVPSRGGAVLLYRSKDLRNWEYLHFIAVGAPSQRQAANPVDSGDMWECPDLFPLGGKHVLIYSSQGSVHWQSGVLDELEMRFHPEKYGVLDFGTYYAAKTQLDRNGNRILWGWIGETRPQAEYEAAGWAGMMSLPRVLTLRPDGELAMEFSPAIEVLREREQGPTTNEAWQGRIAKAAIENCCGEIRLSFLRGSNAFRLSLRGKLLHGEMAEPILTLEYDPGTPLQMRADGKPVAIAGGRGALEIVIYLDGSVAEVILQRSAAYTRRFYYPGSVAPNVRMNLEGAADGIRSLAAWKIHPISPNRLTT